MTDVVPSHRARDDVVAAVIGSQNHCTLTTARADQQTASDAERSVAVPSSQHTSIPKTMGAAQTEIGPIATEEMSLSMRPSPKVR